MTVRWVIVLRHSTPSVWQNQSLRQKNPKNYSFLQYLEIFRSCSFPIGRHMTDRSFSFVRIHTRIDLRSHTAASYPCISNIASCMPSPVRCTLILQKKSRTFSRPAYSSVNSSNLSSSTTAWALPFTPSFNITLDIWFLTVLSDMFISFAISLVL